MRFLVSFSDRFVLECDDEIMNSSYWGKGFYVRGWRIMMASLPVRTVRRKPARGLQQSLKEGLYSAVGMVVDFTGGRLPMPLACSLPPYWVGRESGFSQLVSDLGPITCLREYF